MEFKGTKLTPQEIALLIVALRADLPEWYDNSHVQDTQDTLELDYGYLYRPSEIAALQLSDDGRGHLVDVLGKPFVDNVKMLHPYMGFYIDHVHVGHDSYGNAAATYRVIADHFRSRGLVGEIDLAMCQAGRAGRGRRPWHTLAELNEMGYYVRKQTADRVDWRYLWREVEDSQGRRREWTGKR